MPISCQNYDQLELAAMRQYEVALYHKQQLRYQGAIKTLKTHNGQEFLITPEGEEIPLEGIDQIQVHHH